MSDQWLSIVEYARTYNVSDMTVRRRIKTGKLQAVLREGKYYIPVHAETPWRTQNQTSWDMDVRTPEPHLSHPLNPSQRVPQNTLNTTEKRLSSSEYSRIGEPTPPRVQVHHIGPDRSSSHLPEKLHSDYQSRSVNLSGDHLLKFCDGTLEGMKEALKELENYKKSLQSLHDTHEKNVKEKENRLKIEIQLKDKEIDHLKRQVEDLEMLVKVMDEKLLKQSA